MGRAGAAVVLCTLPVNLEAAPHGALPLEDPDFAAGWRALQAGRAAEASARFAVAARARPRDAIARFWLARTTGSREDFERALVLDYPDRCKPSRNALIRRIAAAEGAALADLDDAFAKLGAGGNAFLDEVHWRADWNLPAIAVITAAAGARVEPTIAPRPSPLSEDEARDVLRRTLAYAIQAGEQPKPVLHERLIQQLERVWRERPGLAAATLAGPDEADRVLTTSVWTKAFARPSERGWNSVVQHSREARARASLRPAVR
jgi:hypothetical protein